ncbi:MAG: serine/threonine protein phosphatase [Gammaproteobacteria bacterium]|nr:MAG: serine/threonine protein phosphatase [Gammaproteobacteria bacterium]
MSPGAPARDRSSDEEPFDWRSCALSTVGSVRKHNEDSYLALPDKRLWVVADGMGGHMRGDVASQAVIAAYELFEPKRTVSATIDDLEERALKVNAKLRENLGEKGHKVMGSTVAIMYAKGRNAFFLWAGDSRIYRYRRGRLEQISHDHSFIQESVDRNIMSAEEASAHPSSNIITRAVGVHQELYLDLDYCPVEAGDKFLLCSDGLFKDVRLAEIAEQLNKIPFKAAEGLIDLALSREANDNVTVIVVEAHPKD